MTTHRASNLGNLFNARRVADRAAHTPESMPYSTPVVAPEDVPANVTVSVPDNVQDSTMETLQDVSPEAAPAAAPSVLQDADLVVSNVAIYLPAPVLDRLKRERGRRKMPYTDLLITAFDELSREQLLEALGYKPQGSGMPRRRGTGRGQGGIQVQLRLDQLQRSWLDEQVQALGALSRSALVAAVYDFWLPKR
ncbi:hypothetical protein ACWEBH_09215 [Micrococcus endophyticus]